MMQGAVINGLAFLSLIVVTLSPWISENDYDQVDMVLKSWNWMCWNYALFTMVYPAVLLVAAVNTAQSFYAGNRRPYFYVALALGYIVVYKGSLLVVAIITALGFLVPIAYAYLYYLLLYVAMWSGAVVEI